MCALDETEARLEASAFSPRSEKVIGTSSGANARSVKCAKLQLANEENIFYATAVRGCLMPRTMSIMACPGAPPNLFGSRFYPLGTAAEMRYSYYVACDVRRDTVTVTFLLWDT